jgi:hypothetical protein
MLQPSGGCILRRHGQQVDGCVEANDDRTSADADKTSSSRGCTRMVCWSTRQRP